MNERIREIAEQAGFFPQRNWDHTGWHAAGHNDKFEMFVKLIVQECCVVGEQYADGLFDSKQYAFVNKKIKQHFGVEDQMNEKLENLKENEFKVIPIHSEIEPHPCPYKMELFNDFETLCTCDEDQEHECAMDV